jgi:hypothetical protein
MDRIQSPANDHSGRTAPPDVLGSDGSRLRRALDRSRRSSDETRRKD